MTRKIREYKNELDSIISQGGPDTDWDMLCQELLIKISFYQHERLVHLIVTMTVSLILVASVLTMFLMRSPAPLALIMLIALFIVLLVPYIVHYFKLENAVQDIYRYYDVLREKRG